MSDWPRGSGLIVELGRDSFAADVSVTGTGLVTVITCPTRYFSGAPVTAEFACRMLEPSSTANATLQISVCESGSVVHVFSFHAGPSSSNNELWVPLDSWARFTPSAGEHSYTICAQSSVSTGTTTVYAPGFVRWEETLSP